MYVYYFSGQTTLNIGTFVQDAIKAEAAVENGNFATSGATINVECLTTADPVVITPSKE